MRRPPKRPPIIDPQRSAEDLAAEDELRIQAVKQARQEFTATASLRGRYVDERIYIRYRVPQLMRLHKATGIAPSLRPFEALPANGSKGNHYRDEAETFTGWQGIETIEDEAEKVREPNNATEAEAD